MEVGNWTRDQTHLGPDCDTKSGVQSQRVSLSDKRQKEIGIRFVIQLS